MLGARSKTGAKHRKRVPPTETHKRGIGPAQKTHRKGHRKMASIDHIEALSLSRCTRRVVFVYPTPAQFLVAAHPAATQCTGAVWALVVELGPAPPRCPSES